MYATPLKLLLLLPLMTVAPFLSGASRSVGHFNTNVGDTEGGRHGTGVDFSNSTL